MKLLKNNKNDNSVVYVLQGKMVDIYLAEAKEKFEYFTSTTKIWKAITFETYSAANDFLGDANNLYKIIAISKKKLFKKRLTGV